MNNESHNNYSFHKIIVIIFNYSLDIGFVLLPLVGYIHQYMKIKVIQSTEGFSKLVSFILIMAYITRIFFWIGKHFEITILINAIFGIIMQLLLCKYVLNMIKNYKKIRV